MGYDENIIVHQRYIAIKNAPGNSVEKIILSLEPRIIEFTSVESRRQAHNIAHLPHSKIYSPDSCAVYRIIHNHTRIPKGIKSLIPTHVSRQYQYQYPPKDTNTLTTNLPTSNHLHIQDPLLQTPSLIQAGKSNLPTHSFQRQ